MITRFSLIILISFLAFACNKKSESPGKSNSANDQLYEDYSKIGLKFHARLYPKYWETFSGSATVVDIKDVKGIPYIFYYDDHVAIPNVIRLNMYGKLENRAFNKLPYEGCGVGTQKITFKISHNGDLMNTYFDYPNYFLCNSTGINAQTDREFEWLDELSGNLYAMEYPLYNGYTAGKPILFGFENTVKWSVIDTVQETKPTQSFCTYLSPKGNIYLAYSTLDNLSVAKDGSIVLQGFDGSIWQKLGQIPAKNVNDISININRPNTIRIIPNGEQLYILLFNNLEISVFKYASGILETLAESVPTPYDLKDKPFCVYNNQLITFNIGSDYNTNPLDGQTLYAFNGTQFSKFKLLNVQTTGGGTYAIRNIFNSNNHMFICAELMINSNVITDIIEIK
jgi:hypothetical protein